MRMMGPHLSVCKFSSYANHARFCISIIRDDLVHRMMLFLHQFHRSTSYDDDMNMDTPWRIIVETLRYSYVPTYRDYCTYTIVCIGVQVRTFYGDTFCTIGFRSTSTQYQFKRLCRVTECVQAPGTPNLQFPSLALPHLHTLFCLTFLLPSPSLPPYI